MLLAVSTMFLRKHIPGGTTNVPEHQPDRGRRTPSARVHIVFHQAGVPHMFEAA